MLSGELVLILALLPDRLLQSFDRLFRLLDLLSGTFNLLLLCLHKIFRLTAVSGSRLKFLLQPLHGLIDSLYILSNKLIALDLCGDF